MSFHDQAALCVAYTFLIIQDSIYSQTFGLLNMRMSYRNSKVRYCLCCHVWVCVLFCLKSAMYFFTRNHQSNHFTYGFQLWLLFGIRNICSDITDLCCCLCFLLFLQKQTHKHIRAHLDAFAHQYFLHQIDQFDRAMYVLYTSLHFVGAQYSSHALITTAL